ncbi:hypothetical protein L3556_00915 [Candidatus Synechococcus calcipolaris G9]|uniref:Uncharacterized protein n=1 Tax=Candidatus Synechococcus calcipolaris G9 TaxID=1497997 RepID=A0ABT6EUE7_9SYNE|nr:hypothetical protein [Candidatus Synechococcus calcipolaris]MDG2989499.1 hypothetical protein [Candidatus Synechococcus calcipolaris G9]
MTMRPAHIPVTPLVLAAEQQAKLEARLRDSITVFLADPRALEVEAIAEIAAQYKQATEAYWQTFAETHGL